jgi:hypothetical protein
MTVGTERLLLEPLSRAHADAWVAFMTDGDARAGLHTPEPAESADAALAGLDAFAKVAEMYALVERASGGVVGFVGFVPRTMEWGDEFELVEMFPVGPGADEVGIGYQNSRRVFVSTKYADRLARLDQQGLIVSERL